MDYQYFRQIQPERGIQSNFASGQINFKFEMDSKSTWNPSKSYLKIKLKLSKGDDSRITKDFGIALNMYACDNLFQQLDMRLNGTLVSEWNDYVAQCASLKNRLYKSMNERNAIMSSTNYAQIYINDRIMDISSDGLVQSKIEVDKIAALDNLETLNVSSSNFEVGQDTIQLQGNNGIIQFVDTNVVVPALDIRNAFSVGDVICLTTPATVNNDREIISLHTITTVQTALLMTVTPNPVFTAHGPSNNLDTFNIRKVAQASEFNTQQANDLDLIWTPPLGFFDINDDMCGSYKFELTPHAEGIWQKYVVEGLSNRVPLGANEAADATKYKVEISEINMYIWTTIRPHSISGSKTYTYSDIICSSQNLTTNSLTSKVFPISDRNHSITLAYQDSAVGDDITLSRSKFKILNNEERNLVKYYIQKDGITLPDPIPRLDVNEADGVAGGINNIIQRYYETLQYSGGYEMLSKHETVKEWLDAGLFLHYKWGKGYKKTDSVTVYSNFSSGFTNFPQVLLFDHYYCTISMNIVNGVVTNIVKS